MTLRIISDKYVYITNTALQNGSGVLDVDFVDPLVDHEYAVLINGRRQEIINNKITIQEFTKGLDSVIIKVEISQMGNVVKVIASDKYPIRQVPILGNTLTEAFPVGLSQIIHYNNEFQENLKKTQRAHTQEVMEILEDFRQRVLKKENEGEII